MTIATLNQILPTPEMDIFASTFPGREENSFDISEDVLVLSCVIKRLRDQYDQDPDNFELNTMRKPVHTLWLSEDDKLLSGLIKDEDRELAANIRKYYEQKMLMFKLRDGNLSTFREKLIAFLSSNHFDLRKGTYSYRESFIKIAFRLPYFYQYDLGLTEIFGGDYISLIGKEKFKGKKKLTYIGKLNANKRTSHSFEYWFKDDNDNRVLVPIEKGNPLIALWERHLTESEVTFDAHFIKRMKDKMEFYEAPINSKLVL